MKSVPKMNEQANVLMMAGPAVSTTDIRYLSGFTAGDPFWFLQTPTQNYLVVSPMEKGRATLESKPETIVLAWMDLSLREDQPPTLVNQAVGLLKKVNLENVAVPKDFPVSIYNELKKKGVKLFVLETPTAPQRNIKSADELVKLRESQRAAVAATQSAIELIASSEPGKGGMLYTDKEVLTSERVRRQVHHVLLDHDCAGIGTIIAGGDQAVDCHHPGSGPLYAGQAIVMDIFPRSERHGYWGDMTRTVCRGPASKELKRLYNTVKTAQLNALKMVRPGVEADSIHQYIVAFFKDHGYETGVLNGHNQGFIHGTGHGVGLDIHEQPSVSNAKIVLEPGHVITIEPGLYYLGLGGVRIEDTVEVVEDGFRFLAPCPKKFEI